MNTLKILLGVSALVVAWLFVFRARIIFFVNAWVRENIFTDKWVLFSGRRVAILLIILGVVALFSGVQGIVSVQPLKPQVAAEILEQARTEMKNGNYRGVIRRCRPLVRSNRQDPVAMSLMASAFWALGEKKTAALLRDDVVRLDPLSPLANQIPAAKDLHD